MSHFAEKRVIVEIQLSLISFDFAQVIINYRLSFITQFTVLTLKAGKNEVAINL